LICIAVLGGGLSATSLYSIKMNFEFFIAFIVFISYSSLILYRLFYKTANQKENFVKNLLKYMTKEKAEEEYNKYYKNQKQQLFVLSIIMLFITYKLLF